MVDNEDTKTSREDRSLEEGVKGDTLGVVRKFQIQFTV